MSLWKPIGMKLRINGVTFACRNVQTPHVVFEAAFFKESESWEMPNEYWVLQNMTTDTPIDDDWDYLEWASIGTVTERLS